MRIERKLLIAAVLLIVWVPSADAQTPLAEGLEGPTRMTMIPGRALLVSEAGTTPNTGHLTRVGLNGDVARLVSGLPSGPDVEGAPLGPTAIAVRTGRSVYLAIGTGDTVVFGPAPGTEIPNPAGPSSPIFSSILRLDFSRPLRLLRGEFLLSEDDHETLAAGNSVHIANAEGEFLTIHMVHDFPDTVPDPITNVRASNPFGMIKVGFGLFVADAGLNRVVWVGPYSGSVRTVTEFAPLPNPLPFGPPVVDAVPTNVAFAPGIGLLVGFLTGFPFPPGGAEVHAIDLAGDRVLIQDVSSVLDVGVIPRGRIGRRGSGFTHHFGKRGGLFVLEFSTDMLNGAPGRLLLFDAPGQPPVKVIEGLITATDAVFDRATGTFYVSEIFTGRIVKVTP